MANALVSSGTFTVGVGYDYPSFSAAEASKAATLTGDLTYIMMTSTFDTTVPYIDGTTCGEYTLKFTVDPSVRHTYAFDTGYVLQGAGSQMHIYDDNVVLDGIALKKACICPVTNGQKLKVLNMQIYENTALACIYAVGAGSTITVANCLISSNATLGYNEQSSVTSYWYNNTLYGNTRGLNFSNSGAKRTVYNNVIYQSASVTFNIVAGVITSSCNVTNDNYSPDVDGRNKTIVFVSTATYDFRLSASDTSCMNNGKDLSTDSWYAFNVDGLGTTRPQGTGWERGFYEYVPEPSFVPRFLRFRGKLKLR